MNRFEDYESIKDLLSDADRQRHEAGIITTMEMDGCYTKDDIVNQQYVVMQCIECDKWTVMRYIDHTAKHTECSTCGSDNYDLSSMKSLRTYDPDKDKRRRIKAIIKKRKHKK